MIYIIDLIAIAVIIFSVVKCAKDGFAKSLLETVGVIVSFAVSLALGNILSRQIYDSYLYEYAERAAQNFAGKLVETEVLSESINTIPKILQNALASMNIQLNQIDVNAVQDGLVSTLLNTIFEPALVFVLAIVVFLISFWAMKLLLKAVGGLLKGINAVPLIGGINKILGAFLGIIKGAINLFLIAQVIHLIHIIFGDVIPFISSSVISETTIFSQIYNLNMFSFF